MPVLIAPTGSRAVPFTYKLSQLEDFVPTSITASFDGAGASGPWVPCVSFYSQDGLLLARCPVQHTLAVGDVAEVTFAPFLRSLPEVGAWHYATPLAPAPTPGDFSAGDGLNAAFANGWLNGAMSDGTFSPLRWRLLGPNGDIELVGVIDGGAIGTTVVTLPAGMRPLDDAVGVVGSADGSQVFTVTVSASTGAVVVISSIPISPGAAGPASGDLTGTYPSPAVRNVSALTTKGDLLVGTGSNVTARLPVGTDNFVLTADSAQTDGVKWAAGGGGVTSFAEQGQTALTGAVTISAGAGVTMVQSGQNVAISSSASGSGSMDGWLDDTAETWTFVSASSFKITGVNLTTKYTKGTRIKMTQTTVKYFVVVSSAFAADTTVTVTAGTDYTIANAAISLNFHSYEVNPQGYPTWFTFAPAVTGYAGSPTIQAARFSVDGSTVRIMLNVTGTSNSTTTGFTAPIATVAGYGHDLIGPCTDNSAGQPGPCGAFINGSGTSWGVFIQLGGGNVWTAANTKAFRISGFYEF